MEVYHASAARVEHDEAYHAILEAKYARIIEEMSKMYHITMEEAMDRFYSSDTLQLMEEALPMRPSTGNSTTSKLSVIFLMSLSSPKYCFSSF